MKAQYSAGNNTEFFTWKTKNTLNPKQRQIYNIVINTFDTGEDVEQFLINIDDEGDSGESYVIKVLSSHLQQHANELGVRNPLIQAAPTGVAANNINRFTLH